MLSCRPSLEIIISNELANASGNLAWGKYETDEAKGEWAKAIEKYNLAIKLDPKNAVAYNSLGIALGKMDKPVEAIEQFTRATELDSKFAGAYTNWGMALGKSGEPTKAIKKFTLATDADPAYAEAFFGKALALRNLSYGDYPADRKQRYARDAADAFQEYYDLVEPDTAKAKYALAEIEKLRPDPPNR